MIFDSIARAGDRRDEAITAPSQRRDVARPILAVAQRLAQARDMKAQAAFFDDDVGPDLRQQLLLADDLVGLGQQRNQNVEAARAQFDGGTILGDASFAGDQAERAKRYDLPGPSRRHHDVFFRVP
jgi:hypothetical protein